MSDSKSLATVEVVCPFAPTAASVCGGLPPARHLLFRGRSLPLRGRPAPAHNTRASAPAKMPALCIVPAFAAPAVAPRAASLGRSAARPRLARPLRPTRHARRPRPRAAPTACAEGAGERAGADASASAGAGAGDESSATARMAALLGRDVNADAARQREEAEKLAEANRRERSRNIKLAIASALVGFLFALVDVRNPDAPIVLMKKLEMASPPISVIGNGKPTLVDVGATWCTNCKAAAPGLYRLATSPRFEGKVNFIVVDADNPDAQDIVERFEVDGIPHQVLLDGKGKIMATLVGSVPTDAVESDLQALLRGQSPLPFVGAAYNDVAGFEADTAGAQ